MQVAWASDRLLRSVSEPCLACKLLTLVSLFVCCRHPCRIRFVPFCELGREMTLLSLQHPWDFYWLLVTRLARMQVDQAVLGLR